MEPARPGPSMKTEDSRHEKKCKVKESPKRTLSKMIGKRSMLAMPNMGIANFEYDMLFSNGGGPQWAKSIAEGEVPGQAKLLGGSGNPQYAKSVTKGEKIESRQAKPNTGMQLPH